MRHWIWTQHHSPAVLNRHNGGTRLFRTCGTGQVRLIQPRRGEGEGRGFDRSVVLGFGHEWGRGLFGKRGRGLLLDYPQSDVIIFHGAAKNILSSEINNKHTVHVYLCRYLHNILNLYKTITHILYLFVINSIQCQPIVTVLNEEIFI